MSHEVITELQLYSKQLRINTVLVIRGFIFRQSCEDGQTAFILNECPRLVLDAVTAKIGDPVPLMKACEQNKYHDYHLKYGSEEFAIPYTEDFKSRNFNLFMQSPQSYGGKQLSEEEQQELMAIQFPTNYQKTEDLAERVIGQKDERFKNKQQVLFGGTQQSPQESKLKMSATPNQVSFKILAYACYYHEGISLLRRLSRSAFIMTYNNNKMLGVFKKKLIELPLYSNDTLVVSSDSIDKGYKIMNGKNLRELGKDHIDCVGLRTVTYLDNLSSCERLRSLTHPLVFSPLIDLDESHEVISILEKDILTDFTFHLQVENVNSVMYQMVFSVLGKL